VCPISYVVPGQRPDRHFGTLQQDNRTLALPEGLEVELRSIAELADVAGFDAFVLGSSIYTGHRNKEAVAFMRRNQALLKGHSVWLFSSGPIGDQERVEPVELADLKAVVSVREHKLFGGAVKVDQMSFSERRLAKAMKVSGDNREWPAIDAWSDQIRVENPR